jgi:hypothetical protein
MKKIVNILSLAVIILATSACENYFGDKTDLGFIDIPIADARQVAYVPIQPALTSFNRPVDICIGFDELIYIVDETTEEVICIDESGRELGRLGIPGAKTVVQDRRFDLLVIGDMDTIINSETISFTAIYRVRMLNNDGYNINTATIVNKVVHPFYEKSSFSTSDKQVEFNRIGIVANNFDPDRNNQYYVSRSGPSSNSLNPDDAVIWFDNTDQLISNVAVNTSSGLFRDYFEDPFGLTTLSQPPQFTAVNSNDFLYASLNPDNALKVQYIEFQEGEFGADYRPRILESGGDTSRANGFINSPGKFVQPVDVTVSGDGTNFIFVADIGTDSVYQFTATGLEGVLPPPATGINKYQQTSFGGLSDPNSPELTKFNDPMAVAYFNEILYVADAGNGRILRFKLTTDFD